MGDNKFIGYVSSFESLYWPSFRYMYYDGKQVFDCYVNVKRYTYERYINVEKMQTTVEYARNMIQSLWLLPHDTAVMSDDKLTMSLPGLFSIRYKHVQYDSPCFSMNISANNLLYLPQIFHDGELNMPHMLDLLQYLGKSNSIAMQNIILYFKIVRPEIYNKYELDLTIMAL